MLFLGGPARFTCCASPYWLFALRVGVGPVPSLALALPGPSVPSLARAPDDALKAVQAEKIVETIISARSAQRIGCVGGKVRWKD